MTAVLAGEGNFQIGHGGPPPCSLLGAQRADDLHESIAEFQAAGLAFRRDWTPLTNPPPKIARFLAAASRPYAHVSYTQAPAQPAPSLEIAPQCGMSGCVQTIDGGSDDFVGSPRPLSSTLRRVFENVT